MTKVIKGKSSYQIILSCISNTLLFLIFWETAKNVKHTQNFKKSMITYFVVVIDKDEMLSCVEPEALKAEYDFKTQCFGF